MAAPSIAVRGAVQEYVRTVLERLRKFHLCELNKCVFKTDTVEPGQNLPVRRLSVLGIRELL